MEDDITAKSTREILGLVLARSLSGNSRYAADREIIGRWESGDDLKYLVGLLQSETTGSRLLGAYYLEEIRPIEELKEAAMRLAEDPLPDCRRAFVSFTANSGGYDREISESMAKCLHDLDLYVRASTIGWATGISDERFEDFAQLVQTGGGRRETTFRNPLSNDFWNASSLARGVRGINIIRRLRDGEDVEQIRQGTPEEDSLVFDRILFLTKRRERYAAWQRGR